MGVRPVLRASRVALLLLAAGCHLPGGEGRKEVARPEPAPKPLSWLAPATDAAVARAAPPAVPPVSRAPAVPPPLPAEKAAAALTSTTPPAPSTPAEKPAVIPPPDDLRSEWVAAGTLQVLGSASQKIRPPVLIREQEPPLAPPKGLPAVSEPPGALPLRPAPAPHSPVAPAAAQPRPVPPGEFLPPIPALPDAPLPAPVKSKSVATQPAAKPRPTSDTPPAALPPPSTPPLTVAPAPLLPPAAVGIEVDGRPVPFDTLSKLVDGNSCPHCGGGMGPAGCTTCGDCGGPQCRAGGRRCEPFPDHTIAGRVIGLIYSSVCCPDPCYQPHWEPLADSAFFTDAVRPKTATKFRWDHASHFAYPDRGEYFFARGDGMGRGPKAFGPPLKAIPYADYNELMLITEAATGPAGVQIAVPYRSVNSTPFGQDGAGFADMQITAKTMLLDSELALFGFQMRTYIPIGQPAKGLGTGHVSLEPALNFGLRLAPETYMQAQVLEWIPLGGDKDYAGAHLRWAASFNHVLWRPIRDVQLIGTLETTGISFQDGEFTDPLLGPTHLAKRTSAALGPGMRLFFCDTLDFGVGWQHGITGKYLIRDFVRFEVRYRF